MANYWIVRAEKDILAKELYGILFAGSEFSNEKEILRKFESNKQWIYDQHPILNGQDITINFVIEEIEDGICIVKKVIIT